MTQTTKPNTPRAAHPYFQRSSRTLETHLKARAADSGPWTVPDLCAAYRFPTKLPIVRATTIAIIELGGGRTQADANAYFKGIGQLVPTIVDVSVDGTTNSPGNDADAEVALDYEIIGAAYCYITGKPATIRIYWCQDIATGVRAAIKDKVTAISISWGADEAEWGKAAGDDMEAAAAEAKAAGIPVFAAAGDNDSSDGGTSAANVDLPAGCPSVIGCGGTSKTRTSETETRTSETVWNNNPGQTDGSGTGGGYSTLFPMPAWQISGGAPKGAGGRMIPDVAANADPETGYEIVVDGAQEVVGGTSAVAPLWAALAAALIGSLPASVGAPDLTSTLWALANRACFVDIVTGNNGAYNAATGPDPCTGLGAPIGSALAGLFVAKAPIGTPPPGEAPPVKPTPTPSKPAPVKTEPTKPTSGKHPTQPTKPHPKRPDPVGDAWLAEATTRNAADAAKRK
jgi:kumamolisin